MGKTRRSGRELDKLDRLAYENEKLKKEISRLRKQLDRIDYRHLTEAAQHFENTGEKYKITSNREKLREKWICHSCGEGHLYLVIVGSRYYRQCSCCDKRTKTKVFTEDVKGLEK